MVDVLHRTCLRLDCNIIPLFNNLGETRGIYCSEHKDPQMVLVTNKKCNGHSRYSNIGDKALYCHKHKESQMVDIGRNNCIDPDCGTTAFYNIFGVKPSYCFKHKPLGARKKPTPKCITPQCGSLATHGPEVMKETHCYYHASKDLLDLHSKKCKSCTMMELLDENNICYFCNPENQLRYLHAKELKVKEYFDAKGIPYTSHDKVINGVTGKERPDFIFFRGTYYIIVEVDEHQHTDRPCECEQIRMVNISQSLGKPTIFIRYNPDKYSKKIGGRKMDFESYNKRMETLHRWIIKCASTVPDNYLEVVQLFFDGYDQGTTVLQPILKMDNPTQLSPSICTEENTIQVFPENIQISPSIFCGRKSDQNVSRNATSSLQAPTHICELIHL